jgi:predicted nucleic acid-binding protein
LPALDTEVLFALDPKDPHHRRALRLLSSEPGLTVPDTALTEFVFVLRAMETGAREIGQIVLDVSKVLGDAGVKQAKTLDTLLLARQCELEVAQGMTFFDSLLAASALSLDQAIVSDDKAFDSVPGLKRIPLG